MKQVVVIVVFLVLAGLLVGCSDSGTAAGKTPRLAVDREVIDFGKVGFEQWGRPVFQVRNEGDGNLRVQKTLVKTIEGC